MPALTPHPANPAPLPEQVEVTLEPTPTLWRLVYRLRGRSAELLLPPPAAPEAADELWRHTCCEAFVGVPGEPAYREFNFSPSGRWAAYAFADTRRRIDDYRAALAPRITCTRHDDVIELAAAVDRALLPAGRHFVVGLAVVAEARGGALSYWALRHPSPQPDFHHRDAFALNLELPA